MFLTNVKKEVEAYAKTFPGEAVNLGALRTQLEVSGDIFSRKNMIGHITTTAFVVDFSARKILLIDHKLHNRWLSSGGHYEGEGELTESAIREVLEETGVLVMIHAWYLEQGCPWDIDTHFIAAQPQKDEGEHYHHDLIYLATADSTQPLIPQKEEVFDAQWFDWDEVWTLNDPRLNRMLKKLTTEGLVT